MPFTPTTSARSDRAVLPIKTETALAALAPRAPALLGPVAPGTITLIRGPRGAGKSWLALALAHAVANGATMLDWPARQAPVLYVETAMAEAALGERLRALGPAPALRLACTDRLDFATPASWLAEAFPAGPGLLVLDGLSLLTPPDRGAKQHWRDLRDWLRARRAEGYAIVLVESARRSAIEALADATLVLAPEPDETQIAFTLRLTSRQPLRVGDRAFRARLGFPDGAARWQRRPYADAKLQEVADQSAQGLSMREGAAALGLSTATYWRRLQEAKAEGLVNDTMRETDETPLAREAHETSETAPPHQAHETLETDPQRKPRETDETGQALRQVSDQVLQRTLEKRLTAPNGQFPRPGPVILATIADAALLDALIYRRPQHADRLRMRFAPLLSALPHAA